MLIIVDSGDSEFIETPYELLIGDDPSSWLEIFSSQAADYGGEGQVSDASVEIKPNNKKQLSIEIPAWSLLILERR